MAIEIITYHDALADDTVAVFNRENEPFRYVAQLTPAIFRQQVATKSVFDPQGCLLAYEGGKAIGLALACQGPDHDKTAVDPQVGQIDGLFFPADRLDVGEKLVARAMAYLRGRGAKTIYGFASFGGYPFWRGIYAGCEPVCLTDYKQAWIAFMACGFAHHQQSLNYLAAPAALPYRKDLTYRVEDRDISSPWAQNSWKGLQPKRLIVSGTNGQVGDIGYVEMPLLADRMGGRVAGITNMHVSPQARRQGIGSSLMGKLFEVLGDSRTAHVLVGTTVVNIPARRTYAKAGMKVVAFRTGTMWTEK